MCALFEIFEKLELEDEFVEELIGYARPSHEASRTAQFFYIHAFRDSYIIF